MSEQEILNAVQDIFRDNFDDDTLEITRSTCADDIETGTAWNRSTC